MVSTTGACCRTFSMANNISIKLQIVLYLTLVSLILTARAQIISHELRRLAASTNQFGLDALKALDRVEPPDKVLVFCPICLSSSLIMIMMGSSKYQVVSSLRHALYVWSMKPQEINRGFRDIFEHIGINQHQQSMKQQPTIAAKIRHRTSNVSEVSSTAAEQPDGSSKLFSRVRRANRVVIADLIRSDSHDPWPHSLSLPKLIKMRELFERSAQLSDRPWWHTIGRGSSGKGIDSVGMKGQETITGQRRPVPAPALASNSTMASGQQLDLRDLTDISQMSALSNIYIQRGLFMNYNYNLLLRQYYKTVIHPVDFLRNTEETRLHINSLVAAGTEGKIKDLVKKDAFVETRSMPKIMMITTFHFRGTLDIDIKTSQDHSNPRNKLRRAGRNISNETKLQETIKSQQQQTKTRVPVFIKTEINLLKYGQFKYLDCSLIEIPFSNRLVTLVIVMPNHHNSTEALLTKLNAQVLSDMMNSLVVRKLSISIPVIKFDRGPVNVEGLLSELGLNDIFFGEKPFSSETGPNKWMRPSDIVHETSIDIGTINPNWTQTEDRLKVGAHDTRARVEDDHIELDKPFFYFVVDSINKLILTMGRIRQ